MLPASPLTAASLFLREERFRRLRRHGCCYHTSRPWRHALRRGVEQAWRKRVGGGWNVHLRSENANTSVHLVTVTRLSNSPVWYISLLLDHCSVPLRLRRRQVPKPCVPKNQGEWVGNKCVYAAANNRPKKLCGVCVWCGVYVCVYVWGQGRFHLLFIRHTTPRDMSPIRAKSSDIRQYAPRLPG